VKASLNLGQHRNKTSFAGRCDIGCKSCGSREVIAMDVSCGFAFEEM
jgi:hypothetical protein